jgi:hypothetical protein
MLASFRPSCDSFGLHENHESFRAIFWAFFDFENRTYAPTCVLGNLHKWMEKIPQAASVWSLLLAGGSDAHQSIIHRHDIVDNHRSTHIRILIALSLHTQQNETQRGFPLPNGDRFVGLGLSTLPCTLYYYYYYY